MKPQEKIHTAMEINENMQKCIMKSLEPRDKIFNTSDLSNNERLMNLSLNLNSEPESQARTDDYEKQRCPPSSLKLILPVTYLKHFIPFLTNVKYFLIFVYTLAVELDRLVSLDLHHGEISEESIGIYYNSNLGVFEPSIILFYYIFQKKYKRGEAKKKHKKDFSDFKSLVRRLDKDVNVIPEDFYELESFRAFVHRLYNHINQKYFQVESNYFKHFVYFKLGILTMIDILINKKTNDDVFIIFDHFINKYNEDGFYSIKEILINALSLTDSSDKKINISFNFQKVSLESLKLE